VDGVVSVQTRSATRARRLPDCPIHRLTARKKPDSVSAGGERRVTCRPLGHPWRSLRAPLPGCAPVPRSAGADGRMNHNSRFRSTPVSIYLVQRPPQPAPNCGLSESEGRSLASELADLLAILIVCGYSRLRREVGTSSAPKRNSAKGAGAGTLVTDT